MSLPTTAVSPSSDEFKYLPIRQPHFLSGQFLVETVTSKTRSAVSAYAYSLLTSCSRFRDLATHASSFCARLGATSSVSAVVGELQALTHQGLLTAKSALLAKHLERGRGISPPNVSTLVITSNGNTAVLERCLRSYLVNSKMHQSREVQFHIFLDSCNQSDEHNILGLLKRLKAEFRVPLAFAGPTQRTFFANLISSRSSVPLSIIQFALGNADSIKPSPGINRNALLLDTIGEAIVCVDDDTECRIALLPEFATGKPCSRFTSKQDSLDLWFYSNRQEVQRAARWTNGDFMGLHSQVLGSNPLSLLQSDCSDVDQIDLDEIDAQGAGVLLGDNALVRLSQSGLIGDSGMHKPTWLIGITGRSRERMLMNQESYLTALTSRQLIRAAPTNTYSNCPFFMSYACGIDNRAFLPPFMPVLRNEDGVFASALLACSRAAFIAHVPHAILHSPSEPRTFNHQDVWQSASKIRLNDQLAAIVSGLSGYATHEDPYENLRTIGQILQDLAESSVPAHQSFVRSAMEKQITLWIQSLQQTLSAFGAKPDYWAEDVAKVITTLDASMCADEQFSPADLVERFGSGAIGLGKHLLADYAGLSIAWSDICLAAKDLKSEGKELSMRL